MKSMPPSQDANARASETLAERDETFAPLSPRRLLLLGGMGLILTRMIFGDIFAVFVLHQTASRVGASLAPASHAALAGDCTAVAHYCQDLRGFLDHRAPDV